MAKSTCMVLPLLCLLCLPALGQPLETVIGPPLEQPFFASRMVFPIYFHNSGDSPFTMELPLTLECELVQPGNTVPAVAQRIDPMDGGIRQVQGGSYTKALYAIDLPATLIGPVRLSAPALNAPGMLFVVESTPPAFSGVPAEDTARAQQPSRRDLDLSVFINAYQPYAKNISFYEPMYFLFGLDPEETKFQISFKYRLLNAETNLARKIPWARNFFFGYTQTSFWDLASNSMPFEDTSYQPELFFQTPNMAAGMDWLKGLFIQTGFEHESNGGGGDRSRSTNYYYLEPSFIILNEKEVTGLRLAPRFWVYINNNDRTNPDLEDYRGYFDLRLTFGKGTGLIWDSHMRLARAGSSLQVALTYPLHRLFGNNLEVYLQVEYVNALGESLLHYTERTRALRFGIAIVR